jgi:EAL domain-containing protein (putative c-di-GMP-specific phosphodiesterase class I)
VALIDGPVPIESDAHVLRARRTAALTRMMVGLAGVALLLAQPHLVPQPRLGLIGCGVIAVTALVQMTAPRLIWRGVEESLSASAGLLIIGFGPERVTVLTILWLVAITSGVLARGGRVHWLGPSVLFFALALPVIRNGSLNAEYVALCAASTGLVLTSGRLTMELNLLLRQARLQAESAETLLFAGDIATRMAERRERGSAGAVRAVAGATPARGEERRALARMIDGEGLTMVVQPIVDVRDGTIHAYEALARFDRPLGDGGPLSWFALAEEFGERDALERACLARALELFARRPSGTSLSVNLSAPVLLDDLTMSMLHGAVAGRRQDLDGLIIEITEETLVEGDMQLSSAIAPLRALGAQLAVDDMGAGYSGLRQITSVQPGYLKLDRSLVTGVHSDNERAALVGALAGYSRQVGCLLVAEGVETEAELREVRRLGVPLVQGFYLARPGRPWPALDRNARPVVGGEPISELLAAKAASSEVLQPA